MNAINKISFKQKMKNYAKHPGSLIIMILVCLAALISVAVLVTIIGYVLIRGIPHL